MTSKFINFEKRCFLIVSGVTNALGKALAIETSRRLAAGSAVLLIDAAPDALQEIRKEIEYLEHDIDVFSYNLESWNDANIQLFEEILTTVMEKGGIRDMEMALILHNEGSGATQRLLEPDTTAAWQDFVQTHVLAVVALDQAFLELNHFTKIEKFVVNLRSSLMVRPLLFDGLDCSGLKARDMYFRAMANAEQYNGVSVLNYSPGILESHYPEFDSNNNEIDLSDLKVNAKLLELARVSPLESTMKLINILEEMSFISGHDVDYYDTFVL